MAVTTSTPKRRSILKRIALITIAALSLTAVTLSIIWFAARGSISEALRRPPTLDSSTPRTQGPFTLVDIARESYDGNVYLHYPAPDGLQVFSRRADGDGMILLEIRGLPNRDFLGKSGYASERKYKLSITASNGDSYEEPPGDDHFLPTDDLIYSLPWLTGPSDWRYLDITVSDITGQRAHWRLDNLPHLIRQNLVAKESDRHVVVDGLSINTDVSRIFVGKDSGVLLFRQAYKAE
jgi:hypothetical protein